MLRGKIIYRQDGAKRALKKKAHSTIKNSETIKTLRVHFGRALLPHAVVDFVGKTVTDNFRVPENSKSEVLLLDLQL